MLLIITAWQELAFILTTIFTNIVTTSFYDAIHPGEKVPNALKSDF